ncbi:MAG: carbohydrate kinase family protein [Nitrososphaeraceae archaeon]
MIDKLVNLKLKGSVVVMADFFVDRIIKLKSKQELLDIINRKVELGAEAIPGIPTYERAGGKAVNVAHCLAKLGIEVTLLTIANKIGVDIIKDTFSSFGDKINLHVKSGKQGYNTAFEFLDEISKVFLSDIGDNNKFGPKMVSSEDDLRILSDAAAVALVDWSSNSLGTELAEHIFKNSKKALHFIDPGDIQKRENDLPNLLSVIRAAEGILSVNENEFSSILNVLNFDSSFLKVRDTEEKNIQEHLKRFAEKVGISIDLHAKEYTACSNGNYTAFFPTRKVHVRNLVGAGDSWDAADIVGYLAGLDPKERLIFSNMYCSLFISNPESESATMNEVIQLLKNQRLA